MARTPTARHPVGARAQVSPARRVAFDVLRRVFEQDAYADRALRAEAERAGLDARDRALATALTFGAVQRSGTLDHLISELADRPVGRIDAAGRAALRLGMLQLCFMDGIPAHAAVDDSVQLAKRGAPGAAGLVNAVLRRAAREGRALVEALSDDTPDAAALRHSVPEWIARLWWDELGATETRALLARGNEPAEAALRVNTLVTDRDRLADELGVPTRPADRLPEGLVLEAPFDAHGSALWAAGALTPQSRASMLVARVLDPRPGQRVLDLCAAPGAKTTHVAALMDATGEVVAVERHPGRAGALRETARRMRAPNVTVIEGDAAQPPVDGEFDRVLVDPPCSGLGTLSSRPDLRWRASPEAIEELVEEQRAILVAGAARVAPGGALVYSTCTISAAENERVIEHFLPEHPDFRPDDLQADYPLWKHPSVPDHLQLLPSRDGTDGFFIARLRRSDGR